MYNRLLFYCPQLLRDVIFCGGLKSMSPETAVRETLPTLNVAVERFECAVTKEAFLRKLRTAKVGVEEGLSQRAAEISTPFTFFAQ
jgi:hypothetical protein